MVSICKCATAAGVALGPEPKGSVVSRRWACSRRDWREVSWMGGFFNGVSGVFGNYRLDQLVFLVNRNQYRRIKGECILQAKILFRAALEGGLRKPGRTIRRWRASTIGSTRHSELFPAALANCSARTGERHHLAASWALSPMMSYWDSFAPVRMWTCFPSFQTATAAPAGCFQRDSR